MVTVTRKKCSKCQKTKSADHFYKCPRLSSGLESWCKACKDALTAKWMTENREKWNQQQSRRAKIYYWNKKHGKNRP